jgi:flagellar basal body P-ring formation protein FlgA
MLRFAQMPVALAVALLAPFAIAQTGDPVVLLLHTEASVAGPVVKIGDIARIDGGSATLRDAFAKLDIAEWQPAGDRLVVSRNDVKFRLLIRGYDERTFVIAGPPRCVVGRRASPFSQEAARKALQQAVADRAPELAKFLVAKLDGTAQFPSLRIEETDRVRLEGKLLDQGLPLGRTRGEILVLVNGEQKAVVPAALDVSFAQSAEPLEVPEKSGPLIPSRNRPAPLGPLATNAANAANASSAEASTPDAPVGFLVRSRDRVQMIAIIGHVCATMPGEALQDGRMGQTISVRNVDSSKTVSGRVIGRGMVEIERRTGMQP